MSDERRWASVDYPEGHAARLPVPRRRRYVVIGPERLYVDRILDDGSGPVTPEHDVYLIEAPNARSAKWAAFKMAREQKALWWTDLDRGAEHPLAGVRIEDVSAIPDETPDAWGEWYGSVGT